MKNLNFHPQKLAAAKSGMSLRTARKYINLGKLPSEIKPERNHRTRKNPFMAHMTEIESMYKEAPELEAKTILGFLMERYPGIYGDQHLRTLQRRIRCLSLEYGKGKDIIFPQDIKPGRQSQSDWTHMSSLEIEVAGSRFDHLVFHFMLPYSLWESVMVCQSESFDTLTQGYEKAVWQLGGVMGEHRTDNLSAATQQLGQGRQFTERWKEFLKHYHVQPSRNNPGQGHENGSVEKSHDLFKGAVQQHLLLRGSRSFESLFSYQCFLEEIVRKRNEQRQTRFLEESSYLKPLPDNKYHAPLVFPVRVRPSSTIHILGIPYSVPSRLINLELKALIYANHIDLYYGQKRMDSFPKQTEGVSINYRHVVDHLVRKPGAFAHYVYRESMFPHPFFRKAYDILKKATPEKSDKLYLKILQLAKLNGEQTVMTALELLLEENELPVPERIKELVDASFQKSLEVYIQNPCLTDYDQLHHFQRQGENKACLA